MTRSTMRSALLFALATSSAALPLNAQRPGTIELGIFAQRTAFDRLTTLAFGTSPGVAGLVGVYVIPNLAIEAGTAYTWTETSALPAQDASWRPSRARAVYGIPVTENFYPIVGVGVVRNSYGGVVDGSDTGLTGLVGFKTYVRDGLAFRSDVNLDVVGSPFNEGASVSGSTVSRHVNWSLAAGLSLDLGSGRFKDTDRDSVRDRLDLCPDTSLGVGVDSTGCRLDEDLDGVFDEDDACPLTPRGVRVDSIGCRLDGDRDGVFNEDDRCLNTPAGVSVDDLGCALDSDLDLVPDFRDECADTPRGVRVDGVGCRVDGDQDGVFDEDDQCPSSALGAEVDDVGCEILFVEEQTTLVLEGVTFETASAELTPEATQILDRIAEQLVANADVRVRVNGHTDSTGSRASNLTLSQNRAESVVRYLIGRGVPADRMESQGFGPDQPVATNDTPEGRQENRRVELERIG